jgi:hypothetical protein
MRFMIIPRMQAVSQQQLQQTLEAFAVPNKQLRASIMHDALKQTNPNIAEIIISTQYHPHRQSIVTIVQEKPYIIVNNALAITEQAHKAPSSAYPIALQENAIHVTSDSLNEKDLHALYIFMSRLPADVLQNYTITWHTATDIELRHTTRPYCIKTTAQTLFDPSLLKAINVIMDYGESKKDFQKNKAAQWILDVRYKNQIILARQKGGKL